MFILQWKRVYITVKESSHSRNTTTSENLLLTCSTIFDKIWKLNTWVFFLYCASTEIIQPASFLLLILEFVLIQNVCYLHFFKTISENWHATQRITKFYLLVRVCDRNCFYLQCKDFFIRNFFILWWESQTWIISYKKLILLLHII